MTDCKLGTGVVFGMMKMFLNLVVNILKTTELHNLKW